MDADPILLGYTRLVVVAGAWGVMAASLNYKNGWQMAGIRGFCGMGVVLFMAGTAVKLLGRFTEIGPDLILTVAFVLGFGSWGVIKLLDRMMKNPLAFWKEWRGLREGGGPP